MFCGYVRGSAHGAWIERTGLYNVRAGNRRGAVDLNADLLRADDLVLYGREAAPRLWLRTGAWFVQSREELEALGYPTPRGTVYLCCTVERRLDEPAWLAGLALGTGRLTGPVLGAPFGLTWQDLVEAGA